MPALGHAIGFPLGALEVTAPPETGDAFLNFEVVGATQADGATVPKNLLLTSDGELDFSGGSLQLSSGAAAIMQSLSLRLQAVEGEWFLKTTQGLPLFTQVVGQKSPDLVAIRALYQETILETPGVNGLLSFSLSLDDERGLQLSFAVDTDYGQLIATTPGATPP